MKKHYELYLQQHVSGSVEDDYLTTFNDSEDCTYFECKRRAKELSMHIGKVEVPSVNYSFAENKTTITPVDAGLANVRLMCYTETEYTSYQPLYIEDYAFGKVIYKGEY